MIAAMKTNNTHTYTQSQIRHNMTNRKKHINMTFDLDDFDPIGPINLNQGSPCMHSPSFMQIGPRTAEIQKFDL